MVYFEIFYHFLVHYFPFVLIVANNLEQIDDISLQLSHNGCYLDLESTLEEQADLLEGFLER